MRRPNAKNSGPSVDHTVWWNEDFFREKQIMDFGNLIDVFSQFGKLSGVHADLGRIVF